MIDITPADLRLVIRQVYALSSPQGMGHIHYQPGPLGEDVIDAILARGTQAIPIHMDYVNGRACKFSVFVQDGKRVIQDEWYDHSATDLDLLLLAIGLNRMVAA